MFSTFAATNDHSALDDGSFLFDESHDGLLSLPMPHDGIHLKSGIVPITGLGNLSYGRESSGSSIHYGDIQDASEREESIPSALINGHGTDYTPSPLHVPFTPQSGAGNGSSSSQTKSTTFTHNESHQAPINVTIAPHTRADSFVKDPSAEIIFTARTPQSLSRDSQAPSTPELPQSQEKPETRRVAHSAQTKSKAAEVRASSSIPSGLSWPEYGRQCILAAENSRLSPFALHPAEYRLLREHINRAQVTVYLNIRNGILRLWHRNPLVYVSLEEATGCARDKRFFRLARVAYLWLLRNGYINFGCCEVPSTASTNARTKSKSKTRRTIVVVGAGMSGLGCARHLEGLFAQLGDELIGESPPKITVLEARPRVGGRVYSHPFLNQSDSTLPPGHRCTAEMGAQIVTGFEHGNPMNAIIRGQLGLPYHGLRDNTILYDYDGTVVERSQDVLVEKLYNDVLERAAVYRNKAAAQRTIEGDRNLILIGREPSDNGGPCVAELEQLDTTAAADAQVQLPIKEEKPATGVEKLAGRAYQLTSGFNPSMTAAETVQNMGWKLKAGASSLQSLDLDTIAKAFDYPTLGQTMDEGFRQYQSVVEMKPRDMRLLNWHHANLEYANAASVNHLSLSGWDQDIGNEFEGEHTEVIGGYQQVPRGLWQCPNMLDVRFNSPIKAVHYRTEEQHAGRAVRVECSNGESYEADQIILTTPLGVLKSGSIQFQPPLPDWKRDVIDRMGFGLLNKVSCSSSQDGYFAKQERRSFSSTSRRFGSLIGTCLDC